MNVGARPAAAPALLPVTRTTVALLALLAAAAYAAFVGSGAAGSRVVYALLGAVALFPVDRVAGLWRLVTDRRPAPAHYGTAAALDPREGHAEPPDLHLVGRILERRRL